MIAKMERKFRLFIIIIPLLFVSEILFGQVPNLGVTSSFALYTAVGAFDNTGTSLVTGDIGSNTYTPTGFPVPGTEVGNIYHAGDALSSQAATDVGSAYGYLSTLGGDVLGTSIIDGQIITPGTWNTGAASTLNGSVTLDGQGNPNAIFIIRIGGAFATGTFSNIVLTNSASLCNVYWQINGQFDLGNGSVFRGTVIVNGAINLLGNSSLLGRGLSTAGAISLQNNIVTNPSVAAAGTITGTATACQSQTGVLYSVPTITNATGYIWILPTGATITAGNNSNSITVNFSSTASSGDITVYGTNACGNGIESPNYALTISSLPQTSSIFHQ